MILSMDKLSLVEKLQSLGEIESIATTALLSFMQSGIKDENKQIELTKNMVKAHNDKMDVWELLHLSRLDK